MGRSALSQPRRTGAAHDDARLRDRLVHGDETAFAELYEQFESLVFTIAARVTHDGQAAEDVTQEVFLAMWQRPLAFEPAKGSLRGWLAMMAHRRAVDLVRREEAHRRTSQDERLHAGAVSGGDPVGDQVTDADTAQRLSTALKALPRHLGRAIALAYLEGHTYREVATELGLPEGTAKSQLREGLRRLAVALNDLHADDGQER
ncbi:sigma-70 family RNA polymerase sigma factor [Actinoplanes sp. NEAU-A12]|uniref:Sigma-70 family RNA polymerase sigma factor n=1 Tax=Actinoplanes sandaracinus TaxID=3045177 RepID=A0ABT6X0G4_9ACTN|nr:sigma-70 family RNA polymerase sigma factor [Actinoplanes sandaracinus]MDI6105474.1 sigma-70 family RNA polymerase sigma factor [Actinoplanes sandaracinus]